MSWNRINIHTPMTVITDFILAVITFMFAISLLGKTVETGQLSIKLMGIAFILIALGAILAGIYHGFEPSFANRLGTIFWATTLIIAVSAGYFLLLSIIIAHIGGLVAAVLIVVATLKHAFMVFWLIRHPRFKYAALDQLLILGFLFVVELWYFLSQQASADLWILAGILFSLIAGAVQVKGIKLHRHFNHNDLYHIIQIGAIFCFFRGGLLLR